MSEIVERVARDLYEESSGRSDWDEETEWMDERQRTYWRSMARAAIRAMRIRDKAMLDAGTAVLWPYVHDLAPGSTAVAVWEAMIDAALQD